MARSSCGSRPAITSFGVCSTSTSGGTPSFSTTHPSSGVQIARFGAVIVPPSISIGNPRTPTRPPHVRCPTSVPTLNLRNIHGSKSPPDPAVSSMIITLGPWIEAAGVSKIVAVAHRPVADERPAQHVDVVVRDLAAAVEALVDDDGVLVRLRIEVALEIGVAGLGGVGHVDVRDAPAGCRVDLLQVPLDPVAIAQRGFVLDRHDLHGARAAAVGVGAHGDLDDLS